MNGYLTIKSAMPGKGFSKHQNLRTRKGKPRASLSLDRLYLAKAALAQHFEEVEVFHGKLASRSSLWLSRSPQLLVAAVGVIVIVVIICILRCLQDPTIPLMSGHASICLVQE